MNFIENFKMSLESIKANKMRSFLTMLGIIIGISSVITIVSLGSGGKNSITGSFEKMGANNINITVNNNNVQGNDYITLKDIETIKTKVDTVKYISPLLQEKGSVSSQDKSESANVTGCNQDYSQINNSTILYGRFFSESEVLNNKAVALIDEKSAKDLFGYSDAVGKTIKVGSETSRKDVKIIGVVESQSIRPAADTASVILPITFLQNLYPDTNKISSLILKADTKEDGTLAANSSINILESRHNNKGKNVYDAENMMDKLSQVDNILNIFTMFITAVAAISLLVGGIGVMNIMLVSVTERTKEIGIRKAIGATTKIILIQFLTESSIVSLIGGILGMVIGFIASQLIGLVIGVTPTISVVTVLGVILFSAAIGIFFGIYPAKKAANLDPIDALRYE
ncbi:ABC transporter permease [Clostridium sp. WILCCON 0269]|uniref:ABC transporter permease n=1 Tax=Candidatus Clostridium eludens TaxID=3381663 RepID=A0ABW8SI72_9CLOT